MEKRSANYVYFVSTIQRKKRGHWKYYFKVPSKRFTVYNKGFKMLLGSKGCQLLSKDLTNSTYKSHHSKITKTTLWSEEVQKALEQTRILGLVSWCSRITDWTCPRNRRDFTVLWLSYLLFLFNASKLFLEGTSPDILYILGTKQEESMLLMPLSIWLYRVPKQGCCTGLLA